MRTAFCVAEDFNLGAAYVIAYLKSIGHQVRLFFDPSPSSKDEVYSLIKEFNPDLICFSCVTANVGWALHRAQNYRKLGAKILFGGVHPTLCPEDITKEGFDVCVGDGIKYFGGEFNPDELWADREIFFDVLPPVHRAYQIFMTGFGCPFRCSFCNNHQLRPKLIRRSVEGCLDELEHLKERGMKYVLFDDDIFTLNRSWLLSFLSGYRSRINLPFTCFGHSKFIDQEISQLLVDSNCQCVWLGVQSGDETIRKEVLNRNESNSEIREACKIIKRHNLKLMIDHIFGLPHDTYESILNSYNLYKEIKPDVINCYELLYFPKAEINKFGHSKSLYQKQGGRDFKRYAKSFTSLPLQYN